jgi:L-2-hydroxyglutarate oxidase LhgO
MSYVVDTVVVGAGIVGLACARHIAKAGFSTLVIEREDSFGTGTSSRNSEVIHAGLYYRPGSLKATMCRSGRDMLYEYCASHQIPHRQVGKWIVATDATQEDRLQAIGRNAKANGCDEVRWVEKAEVVRTEPALRAINVLSSPRTGIVDSHSLMLSLLGGLEDAGGNVVYKTSIKSVCAKDNGFSIHLDDEEGTCIRSNRLLNASGLRATEFAKCIEGLGEEFIPETTFAKGSYFSYAARSPFQRLIYPVPEAAGLGVHLTLDMAGRARFGPDVEWIDELDYRVDESKREQFHQAISTYWPDCEIGKLIPDYSGVRPKIRLTSGLADDFVVHTESVHGIRGLVNLFGIESPGLTSCLSLADYIYEQLSELES